MPRATDECGVNSRQQISARPKEGATTKSLFATMIVAGYRDFGSIVKLSYIPKFTTQGTSPETQPPKSQPLQQEDTRRDEVS